MHKQVISGDSARAKLLEGVNDLANTVGGTLGPRGRNVIIQKKNGSPYITKDGVTVAKEISFEDAAKNLGSEAIKEAAQQTADAAGDGTTTSTVLAQAIFKNGFELVEAGANPIELKRGMDIAVSHIVRELKSMSKKIDSNDFLQSIATISANNDSAIGEMIAEALSEVGRDGIISVQEGSSNETELEIVEGLEFDRGYLSHFFMNDKDKLACILSNVKVLLFDGSISNMDDVIPLLETCHGKGDAIAIIAHNVEGQALATMVVNAARAGLQVVAVKAPGFGSDRTEILKDMAALTGATLISKEIGIGMDEVTYDHLGQCDRIVSQKTKTALIGGKGTADSINDRVEFIKKQKDKSDSDFEKGKLESRLSKLVGGVAIIKVGAQSEIEMKEKKDRTDDAVLAIKAAIEEGIVPGGGSALLHCMQCADGSLLTRDKLKGYDIVFEACKAPFKRIMENAGLDSSQLLNEFDLINRSLDSTNSMGYDVVSEKFTDLVVLGIIDPTKVTRTALEKAVSVAGTLLTTESMVIFDKESEEKTNNNSIDQ